VHQYLHLIGSIVIDLPYLDLPFSLAFSIESMTDPGSFPVRYIINDQGLFVKLGYPCPYPRPHHPSIRHCNGKIGQTAAGKIRIQDKIPALQVINEASISSLKL
jgi:hypothetical protein